MGTYRVLMSDSTEQKIDLVFKYGSKLAEASFTVSDAFNLLWFTDQSYRQRGIQHCK
jgi:hypothetical protein